MIDPRFSFGTGKIGDLAAFSSAIILGLVALGIGWESLTRLYSPQPIGFIESIWVAVIGLLVNIASAVLLHQGGHDHTHGQGHGHPHTHGTTRTSPSTATRGTRMPAPRQVPRSTATGTCVPPTCTFWLTR
ncbi:cation transporter [Mangrovibrevibacter kandeliae]|uniref:cation transporter n=1 Tax=Mangrovibrevibacter kandeliae TaxID=2968473 RepID=UPI0021186F10|nr:cation transporter [Aurantimonas sp. CSK15Z-1]